MEFTLATILGDDIFVTRADNNKHERHMLLSSLRLSFWGLSASSKKTSKKRSQQQHQQAQGGDDQQQQQQGEACVVSFQKKTSKKRGSSNNKVLGSRLFSFLDHRDSLLVYKNKALLQDIDCDKHDDDDDDETASTVDMDEDEFPVTSSPCPSPTRRQERRSVQFENELVTAVYTRPRTTKDDKYYLHYDEYDYMDFKLEYRDELLLSSGRRTSSSSSSSSSCYRKSPRRVSFKREVVESVHPVMNRSQRKEIHQDLFYSEQEMRTFLDEFVASLQNQQLLSSSS